MAIVDRIANALGVLVFVMNVFNHLQYYEPRLIVHCAKKIISYEIA